MKAVVLERKGVVNLRDIEIEEALGPEDVRVRICAVGICGSDVHYYREGRIGGFVVREPMVLGHEASGVVIETGKNVKNLAVGDHVCMEPGIPDYTSAEALRGMYNLDPSVRFWATPPVHGCLRESVVHPANLTFKLPANVSFHEGALVEPVAIGVYSAKKARIQPGDTAIVFGAGTIGIVSALAAEASGCSRVFIADVKKAKLDFVREHYGVRLTPIDLTKTSPQKVINDSGLAGVDIVFEASGAAKVYENICEYLVPGGRIVLVGMPSAPAAIDVVAMQAKEIGIETIFRYVNTFPRVINMISSGAMSVKPLITREYAFGDSKAAFEYAATLPEADVKIMINAG
ncbi:MAG: NAD(P)-dependent alcohol dehydrogenase [Spirochaetaceae bacterium]|jgi:D-xylulose reductase|nr:NAD(P)-dependent alcohol dehydrogenase [Spirochaetaceae bacterium]